MSKSFLKNIGKIIKKLRKEQGLSQEKLAEKIGISRNYLGMIERAEVNIPILTIYKIAKVLGVKPYELIGSSYQVDKSNLLF
jgi:transcriptional regulator with XRE-family HTH domain